MSDTIETVVVAQEAAPVEVTPIETVTPEVTPTESTILGEAKETVETVEAPKEEAPVVEQKSAEEVVSEVAPEAVEEKDEGGQSEEPAPPPVFETFVLPEGVTLDGERVAKFTDILSDLEVKTKADHALLQETGQKLVDYHINELQEAQQNWTKLAQETWENQKKSWKDEFLADPTLGGNQFQTTVDSALEFIRTHGGTADEQKEFRDLMESSGLGNHKAVIRILANAGRAMSEGKPLAAQKPASAPKSKVSTMYGRNQ